jgi:glycosyltransferase involved in cell wall biosynthesis
LKVCAVTTWPPHRDGVALYSAELYNQIAKLVKVEVASNISKQKSTKAYGNKVVSSSWKRRPWYPTTLFRAVFKTRCNLVHVQHGWLLYGGLVHSLLFPVLLGFFRLSRKPCVVTMHSVIRKDAQIYGNFLVNFLARMAVLLISRCITHFSDNVIVHNHLMKQILQTDYNAKGEKIAIIPHGVKKSSKKPESSKEESEPFYILSLGFLRKEKHIECLLEAFKIFLEDCPYAKLVIVGGSHAHDNTDYSENLQEGIPPKLQEHVLFTGFVDNHILEKLVWKSDVIVLQSSEPNYVEASGALAAVADYGKSLVCSKVPKFQSELQSKKDCIFVEPTDSAEMAQALVLLMKNNELRRCLGKKLREKFKTRYWSAVAKEHVSLYRHLLNNKKPAEDVF